MSIWNRLMQGFAGFRRGWLNADILSERLGLTDADEFGRWEPRRARYDLFWSLYQSNTFQDEVHRWSPALKSVYNNLYKNINHAFNPCQRLGEFWPIHLMGGALDDDAADTGGTPSALPIDADNEAIQPALSVLWKASNWQIEKSVWTRHGAIMGDAVLRIRDNPVRQEVRLEVVHPATLKWVDRDSRGRVKGYILEEWRYNPKALDYRNFNPLVDPRSQKYMVRYNEECFIEADRVVFRTFLNGSLHDWRQYDEGGEPQPPEWEAPYDFVPLVTNQHMNVGLGWGIAEPHCLVVKILGLEEIASVTGDYILRALNSPWLLSGVKEPKPGRNANLRGRDMTREEQNEPPPRDQGSSRSEVKFLYGEENAKATSLMFPLNISNVNDHIKLRIEDIQNDYPEIHMDIWRASDNSGRALRIARQRAESKVHERRAGYDQSLVLAQKMALAIGSIQGYPGYEAFGGAGVDDPALDHQIGKRPVFQVDPLDDLEQDQAFWNVAHQAVRAGCPLPVWLRKQGWSEEDIAELEAAQLEEMKKGLPVGVASTTVQVKETGQAPTAAPAGTKTAESPKVPA